MAKKRIARVANPPQVRAPKHLKLEDPAIADRDLVAFRLSDYVGWVGIFLAIIGSYWPALNGGLLWDDNVHLTRPYLQSFHGLWRIWFDVGATQQYYPLLHSALWLEHRAWGDAVQGYHLINLAFHAISACLVVAIVRRLALPGAWLAGFIFALHPVCVEGVAWISEQKSTLSGVFFLASLLAYLHFDQTRRKSKYGLSISLFVLALLSKTVTAVLPGGLLVILWWKRGRLEWMRDVRPLVPWLVLGAIAGLFTAWIERTIIGAHGAPFLLTAFQRFLLAGRVIWFYAEKLVLPVNLTFSYARWTLDASAWWQWLFPAGVLMLAIGFALLSRRNRGPLAIFLLFSGTLFPVLGFFNIYPFRYSYVADHFQYLASLAIIVPLASLLTRTVVRISSGNTIPTLFSAALVLVLSVLTWRQSAEYSDVETLYRATLARNPSSSLAHNNLGAFLSQTPGRLEAALAEYDLALQIESNYPEAHLNRGSVLSQMPGRLSEAIAEYRIAIGLKPEYAEAHNNLGNALMNVGGKLQEATAEFQAAVRLKPDYAEAHNNLGNALSHIPGRLQEGISEYKAALRINPGLMEAHNNLGNAWLQIPGRLPDAIAEYYAALRIRPDLAESHFNLGLALARTPAGLPEAIAQYQEALRIRPDYANAHLGLGGALSRLPGRARDAIAEYQIVLQINPGSQTARTSIEYLQAALE